MLEILESPAGATRFYVVAPSPANTGKDETTRIVQRLSTDRPSRASVVPRDTDGAVVEQQAPCIGREDRHG